MQGTVFFLLIFFSLPLHASVDGDLEQIQQRIRPIGRVHIEQNQTTTKSVTASVEKKSPSNPGQAIYEKHCVICHRDGIAGAPKFRDEATWKPRLAKSNIDALIATVNKGLNAMPPKGTCQECNDSDIKAAINYMVPQK